MTLPAAPDYLGGSLLNLIAELEFRLVGSAQSQRLHSGVADLIPDAETIVLVVFDGLGFAQLQHPAAASLQQDAIAELDAPFPTTTTVSLATVATGLSPAEHGLLGYQLWMPDLGVVANTIKWTTLWGEALEYDTRAFLPSPNMWERLTAADVEPITVQPEGFRSSKLSDLLYRGCRFEGVSTIDELVSATCDLARTPRRLIVTYVANVDFAAHVYGQTSREYAEAMAVADYVWSKLAARIPTGALLVGTADHGHVDFPQERQIRIPKALHRGRVFYGDGRAMYVKGDGETVAGALPAHWAPLDEIRHLWGPASVSMTGVDRLPDGVLVAEDGYLLLHKHSDDRMVGNHGGLTAAERIIPLLMGQDV